MTKAEAQRRRRRRKTKRMIACVAAWVVFIAIEVLIALAPTAVVAAITIPMAYAERGYSAIGGEWVMIIFTFCGTFSIVHRRACDRIFEEV